MARLCICQGEGSELAGVCDLPEGGGRGEGVTETVGYNLDFYETGHRCSEHTSRNKDNHYFKIWTGSVG